MGKLSKDLSAGVLHPRENLFVSGTIGALNAEVIVNSDGCSTIMLDMRGTFNLFLEVSGTVDGTNWVAIPMRQLNVASKIYLATPGGTGAAVGVYVAACTGFRQVRARCTAYTSGSCTTVLSASNAPLIEPLDGKLTSQTISATGTAGAAVTLTIPGSGVGLRNYVTFLIVERFAAALLTAAATPVLVTTTNIPGTPTISIPADAAAQGTIYQFKLEPPAPIPASAQNSTITVVCPVTTGVIWRVTAGYYVGQ